MVIPVQYKLINAKQYPELAIKVTTLTNQCFPDGATLDELTTLVDFLYLYLVIEDGVVIIDLQHIEEMCLDHALLKPDLLKLAARFKLLAADTLGRYGNYHDDYFAKLHFDKALAKPFSKNHVIQTYQVPFTLSTALWQIDEVTGTPTLIGAVQHNEEELDAFNLSTYPATQ